MDGSRFDQLARGMAKASTRRSMLKGLGGGVVAALGFARTGGRADADICKNSGKACSKGSQCCSGNCAPATSKSSVSKSGSVCCPVGQVQGADGTCTCPTGHIDCGQGCIPGNCCHLGNPIETPSGPVYYGDPRCDDGIGCTTDFCQNHMCHHVDLPCSDGLDCTIDYCDHELGHCVNLDVICDDGDPCTISFCELDQCIHDPIICPSGQTCRDGVCS